MQECCVKGFRWDGTPSGREDMIGEHQVYITGDNEQRAILFNHDALGWQWTNARLLADHFAKEVGATVYLPDFFHGNAVKADQISVVKDGGSYQVKPAEGFDIGKWFADEGPQVRIPEVLAVARKLREQYSWLAAVGYCWGGAINFKLASKENADLFNCISIAHPGTPTEDEVRNIGVPVQILAAEHDPTFEPQWKEFCNKEIPKLGVDYHYQHFPGMIHGFATKCDDKNEKEKKALELAKNAVVYWFVTHST